MNSVAERTVAERIGDALEVRVVSLRRPSGLQEAGVTLARSSVFVLVAAEDEIPAECEFWRKVEGDSTVRVRATLSGYRRHVEPMLPEVVGAACYDVDLV